jgi:serine/threonine-protein kinase
VLELATTTTSLAEEVMASQGTSRAPRLADTSALELEQRSQRDETLWEPEKRRGPWLKLAVGLGVLVALGAGVVVLRPWLEGQLRVANARVRTATVLTIQSQPAGATVIIDGAELGTTPLVMDNIYPAEQRIPVRLTLPGHKPWKGSFTGGQPALLDVKLEKR